MVTTRTNVSVRNMNRSERERDRDRDRDRDPDPEYLPDEYEEDDLDDDDDAIDTEDDEYEDDDADITDADMEDPGGLIITQVANNVVIIIPNKRSHGAFAAASAYTSDDEGASAAAGAGASAAGAGAAADAAEDTIYLPRTRRMRGENDETKAACKEFRAELSPQELKYWDTLDDAARKQFALKHTEIQKDTSFSTIPLKFRILDANLRQTTTKMLMNKINTFNMMDTTSSEYFKYLNWLQALSRLPFGKYNTLPVNSTSDPETCKTFLRGVQNTLTETIYGHADAKEQILRILAQWISNPTSRGHCIGIQGAMGTGKTSFVKDGLCKALGIPFGFIALGGAADGSFLEGHSFTYEGAVYGKIAEMLMRTQCMNPILFFDELDKVSDSSRGAEIIGILTHLTDSAQNERFNDKYFGEIDMDLSKSLIIFSYNDESLINPILKDRMITIRVKGYDQKDKIVLAKDYLLPEIFKQYTFTKDDIIFSEEIIVSIINRVPKEDGVRNLKRGMESIVSWINMRRYVPSTVTGARAAGAGVNPPESEESLTFPVHITQDHVLRFVSQDSIHAGREHYLQTMYT